VEPLRKSVGHRDRVIHQRKLQEFEERPRKIVFAGQRANTIHKKGKAGARRTNMLRTIRLTADTSQKATAPSPTDLITAAREGVGKVTQLVNRGVRHRGQRLTEERL